MGLGHGPSHQAQGAREPQDRPGCLDGAAARRRAARRLVAGEGRTPPRLQLVTRLQLEQGQGAADRLFVCSFEEL